MNPLFKSWVSRWCRVFDLRPPELKVLFVCTANICRSPLAEAMLRHELRRFGLHRRVRVASAGCSVGAEGRKPDPRLVELAARRGIPVKGIRARRLDPKTMARSDYLLVMEKRHLDSIGNSYPELFRVLNIRLLGSFLETAGGPVPDIPDPYFGDAAMLVDVYGLVEAAVAGLAREIALALPEPGAESR